MDRKLEELLHRNLYFALQRLRGRPIRAYVADLERLEALPPKEYERVIRARLERMLLYARENAPLYATAPWRERLERGATDLQSWPVLERATVRAATPELRSRRRIAGTFERRSSASSGEPLSIAWDPSGAGWGWANEYRALLWHGVQPGVRTLLMWGSGRWIDDWVKNHALFRTTELTTERLEAAARYLIEERPGLCQGLPSALTRLARYVRTHHPEAPASLAPYIKAGGEQLYPFQRETLERSFGARVIETYGCTEVGPIAAECPEGSLHILAANVYVEIFRGDEPAPPGEHGDIVVTTLSNRATPLVRCRIGDRGRLRPTPCECGRPQPVIDALIGRAADVFVAADGRPVHGSMLGWTFGAVLSDAPPESIQQMLFIQLDQRRWKVLVESDGGFDDSTAHRIARHVRNTFGDECEVEIERVPVVPREPSGKFRYYHLSRPPAVQAARH